MMENGNGGLMGVERTNRHNACRLSGIAALPPHSSLLVFHSSSNPTFQNPGTPFRYSSTIPSFHHSLFTP